MRVCFLFELYLLARQNNYNNAVLSRSIGASAIAVRSVCPSVRLPAPTSGPNTHSTDHYHGPTIPPALPERRRSAKQNELRTLMIMIVRRLCAAHVAGPAGRRAGRHSGLVRTDSRRLVRCRLVS
jgi:hypothetical protein